MLIKKLTIRDTSHKIIRDIDFKEIGITFIYGDILAPENKKATINSLGKTLLIKMIDYVYGANEDSSIIKEAIHGYVIEAKVKYKNDIYCIVRTLGTSEGITINSEPYSLEEYKEFFNINRSIISKQLLTKKKVSEISQRDKAGKDDITVFLDLLEMRDLSPAVCRIYDSQDKYKELQKSKKDLISYYGNIEVSKIEEEIFIVDKEVEELARKVNEISEKVKQIQISEMKTDVIVEYTELSNKLKLKKSILEEKKIELKRLEAFVINSKKADISSDHVIAIFNKAKIVVPDMVKKEIKDVEQFFDTVFKERKELLTSKSMKINSEIKQLGDEINTEIKKIDALGKIISENEVYQESIGLYDRYSKELQEKKFKEGQLSQIRYISKRMVEEDSNLLKYFNKIAEIRDDYETLLSTYRDFIYLITKEIYSDEVNSFFNIATRNKHKTMRPIKVEVSLKGDTGEGVGEVKKNLMDYLLFRYNKEVRFLVQDSACFNGIDPRQVSNMLKEVGKIAVTSNKQAIIAINKYQIGNDKELLDIIQDNSAITLSESDKLLLFDFD